MSASLRSLLPILGLLAACHFDASTSGGSAAVDPFAPDADPNAPDADPSAPDGAIVPLQCDDWMLAPNILNTCTDISIELETTSLTTSGTYRYNTDSGRLTDNLGVNVPHKSVVLEGDETAPRALVTGNFFLGMNSSMRVVGLRPLIIVSWGGMVIEGDIDVSSNTSGRGAGSNSSLCVAAGPGLPDSDGSSGGGGGGFGRAGGIGGLGRSPQEDIAGGIGGLQLPLEFHGGCPGADGGDDQDPSLAGLGSPGGGALYLLARNSLRVRGGLNAGGQGGGQATGNRAGGGGGGSGGMLALESNVLTLEAASTLIANGGGGGGGADNGDTALAGFSGSLSADGSRGGEGEKPPAGNGGTGGRLLNNLEDQDGTLSDRGGGGAGGAYGYVLLRSNHLQNDAMIVSPLASGTSISAQ
jgi:hypothetical protein